MFLHRTEVLGYNTPTTMHFKVTSVRVASPSLRLRSLQMVTIGAISSANLCEKSAREQRKKRGERLGA